mgnify:CR=1 FL=1
MHAFDLKEVQLMVRQFCDELPGLLAKHTVTAELVPRLSGLRNEIDSPFTVAVVGQMRVGKSSLINAILQKDLAITGVTETTATINWIHHGTNSDIACIHWRDRPPETINRSSLQQWTGDSKLAAETRYIQLFDDAPFLKIATIVDTPGLRSVIDAHTFATEQFLGLGAAIPEQTDLPADHCSKNSQQLGSQADAIVYVLMPVARESDDDFIESFKNNTRLPGSSSYNSIAVIHKWETLNSDNVFAERDRKATQIKKALGDSVASVVAVSAPIARAADTLGDDNLAAILKLARDTELTVLYKLLRHDKAFQRPADLCSLTVAERQDLLSLGIPWPSLKTIVSSAVEIPILNVDEFRERIRQMGCIDNLKTELEQRFFSRSRSIKILSLASKAWEPCQLAQVRLRNVVSILRSNISRSGALLELVRSRVKRGDIDLREVELHMLASRDLFDMQLVAVNQTLSRLGEITGQLKSIHSDFAGDLRCLEYVDKIVLITPLDDLKPKLESLFGRSGVTLIDRLTEFTESNDLINELEEMIDELNGIKRASNGEALFLCKHAIHRLEQIADVFESRNVPLRIVAEP